MNKTKLSSFDQVLHCCITSVWFEIFNFRRNFICVSQVGNLMRMSWEDLHSLVISENFKPQHIFIQYSLFNRYLIIFRPLSVRLRSLPGQNTSTLSLFSSPKCIKSHSSLQETHPEYLLRNFETNKTHTRLIVLYCQLELVAPSSDQRNGAVLILLTYEVFPESLF